MADKLDLLQLPYLGPVSRSGCAVAHRIAMTLRRMGADDEHFEVIVKELNQYINAGLGPGNFVEDNQELHLFRETNQSKDKAVVSIREICKDLKMKQTECDAQDSKLNNLKKSISEMLVVEDELRFDRELKDKLKSKGLDSTSEILDPADLAAFVKSQYSGSNR